MKVSLTGVDPGIIDTGVVRINLDPMNREWSVEARVFNRIVTHENNTVTIDETGLLSISLMAGTLNGVEGYRPRGRNQVQDRMMTTLTQRVGKIKGFDIVENTGIKQVVTGHTLKLFEADRFNIATNHADLKSAARVALLRGYQDDSVNKIICMFFEDMLYPEGSPWHNVSM